MLASQDLVETIRQALAERADSHRAAGQQRYMKSTMPFWGWTAPALRVALKPILDDPAYRIGTRGEWEATVRTLWDEAGHREERYAALTLARHRHYRGWRDSDTMALYRHLVVSGAWWDLVDDVATHLVREVLLANPEVERLRMREWAGGGDLWVRRAAILCQVGARERLDQALLADVIEPNLGDRGVFVRKAVGWALRDHARTDPDWVRGFVAAHEGELSGLSRREALRHIGPARP